MHMPANARQRNYARPLKVSIEAAALGMSASRYAHQ